MSDGASEGILHAVHDAKNVAVGRKKFSYGRRADEEPIVAKHEDGL